MHKEHHQIRIEDTVETYPCSPDESLLRAMERLGRKGIPVGCRGGGCGVCKIRILSGKTSTRRMSRAQVSEQEESEGYVLACRTFAESDIELTVVGTMQKAFVNRPVPATEDNNKE